MNRSASSGDGIGARWVELCKEYDLVRASAMLAWDNFVEAYKATVTSDTSIGPNPTDALLRWRAARALQLAAEQALIAHLQDVITGDASGTALNGSTCGP